MSASVWAVSCLVLIAMWAVGMGLAWRRTDALEAELAKAWGAARDASAGEAEAWKATAEASDREAEAHAMRAAELDDHAATLSRLLATHDPEMRTN